MEKISLVSFEKMILDSLGFEIELDLDQIFLFEINNQQYIGTSKIDPQQGYPSVIIGELTENNLLLFPSLLQHIKNKATYAILKDGQLLDLSHGKSIQTNSADGYHLFEDGYSELIAYGKVESNTFMPIIDLGIYLRFESR